MSINFGIVGYGYMGQRHESMLKEIEGIHVVGVCDIDETQLENAGEGVIRYLSAEELYQNPKIQVVLITTNNNQHKDLVMKAAEAGKDIICEKPAALSVEELDEMIRCTEQHHVRFTVHQQRRYDPDFRTIKELYDSKVLGTPYVIKSSIYGYNGNMHDWHVYVREGGGMLYDWGVHLLDQMLWMIPEKILSVYADIRNVINREVDDYFNIILKFEKGVTVNIELGTYYLSDKPNWYTHHWFIGGDKGSAYIDGFQPEGKIVRTTHLLQNVEGIRTMTVAGPTRSFGEPEEGLIYTEELPKVDTDRSDYFRDFVKAYESGEEFLVKLPEVRRVLRLMEAIRESGRTGKAVAFERDQEENG